MRRLLALALAFCLAAFGLAWAQSKGRARVIPQPAPVVTVAPTPAPRPAPFTPLRSAGLPAVDDRGATCRAQCSRVRYACSGDEDPSDCNTSWLRCLSTCR